MYAAQHRSHSEAQEAAQLLGGVHMPSTILASLIEAMKYKEPYTYIL